MPLRQRLLLSIFLTLALSLAAGSAFTYWHGLAKIETEMQAAIAVGGRIAHNAVDDAEEATNPRRRLELLVADFDGDRHLRATLIADGHVVAMSKLAEPEDPVPDWFYNLFSPKPKVAHLKLPEVFNGVGSIVLQSDAHNEIGELWGDIHVTLSVLGTFCALVLGLVYWTLGTAIRPLQHLSSAFARVGSGDYGQRVSESGPLELTRLYRSFNRMVARLAIAESQNQRLQKQLATVQEEERADLARDLHDEIGPLLFAADVDAVALKQLIEAGEHDQVPARISSIRQAVGQIQKQVRQILSRLRPAVLVDIGLAHAIETLVAFWRNHSPSLHFDVDVPDEVFGEPIDGIVYRIVQESISNAVRHGRPTLIEIAVKRDDGSIQIRVADDGAGLQNGGHKRGYGITGMQERVAAIGGTLEIENRSKARGVSVSARLPAPACRAVRIYAEPLQEVAAQ